MSNKPVPLMARLRKPTTLLFAATAALVVGAGAVRRRTS
ncbi:hypothetical protein SMCF_2612, partial [Streptomyces coelicoflavus ZG0656]